MRIKADNMRRMVENDSNKLARGKRIADAIKHSGKTQREIAALIGVSPQSISKWIQSGSIQAENLWTFAELTDTDIRYLMFGEPTPHADLHKLIDQLSPIQAKRAKLFVNTLFGCEEANMGFTIEYSTKKPDQEEQD